MTTTPSIANLRNLLFDLEVVKPWLVARRADLHAERFGLAVHSYAVDTNILYFIGQPITQILSQDKLDPRRGFHYDDTREQVPHAGSLFRTDERHYHLAIGATLARFIGFTLAGSSPLLLPDALWPEAATLLANFSSLDDARTLQLADRLFRELEQRTVAKIKDKLRAANLNPVHLADLLRKMVQRKIGRHEGLKRIKSLFDDGAIEELGRRPILGVNLLSGLGVQSRKLEDLQEQLGQQWQAVFDRWDAALERAGKQDPHRRLDAEALTQIELRNRAAHAQGSIERTLYITLDSAVILTAKKSEVDYLNCNFAEAFVRHPAAFLNDIGLGVGRTSAVERQSDIETVSILDWIDVMVSRSSPRGGAVEDDPAAEEQAASAVQEIRKGWLDLSELQEDQLFFQLGISQIEKSLHEKLAAEDIAEVLNKLRDEAIEEEADAWENCFRVAIQLALRVKKQDYQRPTRSSPPICFEEWPDAGEAIEQFKIWGASGLSSKQDYDDVRKQLEEGEDRSGYAYFLASSAFFAARGDWAPAAGLASFAREQAFQKSADDRPGANGREASYMEAVARQHLVRHVGELKRPIELIEECERIYEEERALAEGPFEVVPERFKLELLDIEQARYLFQWAADDPIEGVRDRMGKLLVSYHELRGKIQRQVDRLLVDQTPMVLGSHAYVLVQTEIRTIISAFLLVSVGEIHVMETMPGVSDGLLVRDSLVGMLARLPKLHAASSKRRSNLERVETQDSSVLAEVAIAIVSAMVSKTSGTRTDRAVLRNARAALDKKFLGSHYTFPFDARRLSTMRRLLSEKRAE